MRQISTLDIRDAYALLEFAIDRLKEVPEDRRKPVSVAIVDASGHPVLTHRMDGASADSFMIALAKAITAVRCRKNTIELRHERYGENGWKLSEKVDIRDILDRASVVEYDVVSWAGGVLIEGEVIDSIAGAIAVSGLDQLDDHAVAYGAASDFEG